MKAFPNAFSKIFKLILREVYISHLGNIVLCQLNTDALIEIIIAISSTYFRSILNFFLRKNDFNYNTSIRKIHSII